MVKARHYIGVVHKDPDSDYGVSFPEVPGIATAGSTLEEAAAFAEEALGLQLESLAEDGEPWPEPQGLDAVRAHPDAEGAVAFLAVRVPQPPGKLVRVNITMDEHVLARLDQAAGERGLTRSAFLAQAGLKAAREAGGALLLAETKPRKGKAAAAKAAAGRRRTG